MKSFIICLPNYPKSMVMANHALDTGKIFKWDVRLFHGVDGSVVSLDQFDIKINQENAKCREMMTRPGVVGCFLSHWQLWNLCADTNEVIGIFEHDIQFLKPCPNIQFDDIFKLEGFLKKKPRPAGEWYEGARAYLLHPNGARKLIKWVKQHGALPADVNIGLDVVNIKLDNTNCIQQHELYGKTNKREDSFTWNLNAMEKI